MVDTPGSAGAVDDAGNTTFHMVVTRSSKLEEWEAIFNRGVSPNQPNNAGRTPLHILCGTAWYMAPAAYYWRFSIPWLLQRADIEAVDVDGVRPLHIASMMWEYFVKHLLDHGADPAAPTSEGLTPLHLASRARQSNIVGMLIASLRQRYTGRSEFLGSHLNAKAHDGRTPLHYACRSGRHETVALLLEAGADPDVLDRNGMTPLEACMEFEDEKELWVDYRKPTADEMGEMERSSKSTDFGLAVGGTTIQDPLRPFVTSGRKVTQNIGRPLGLGIHSEQDTVRLEEILQLLMASAVSRGLDSIRRFSAALDTCISRCESRGSVYTTRCFRGLSVRLSGENDTQATVQESEELSAHDLGIVQVIDKEINGSRDGLTFETAEKLLGMREYGMIECFLRTGSCSTPTKAVQTTRILRLLARRGFVHLLRRIFSSNDPPQVDMDKSEDALIYAACQREVPNMEVVRFLVEELGVDVNGTSSPDPDPQECRCEDCNIFGDAWIGQNTALHELARGEHWWYVAQGIPYLLALGADTEQRNVVSADDLDHQVASRNVPLEEYMEEHDGGDHTPLEVAQNSAGLFSQEVLQLFECRPSEADELTVLKGL